MTSDLGYRCVYAPGTYRTQPHPALVRTYPYAPIGDTVRTISYAPDCGCLMGALDDLFSQTEDQPIPGGCDVCACRDVGSRIAWRMGDACRP